MFCPHCGKPLAEGAKFCAGCGRPVSPPQKKNRKVLKIVLACAVVLVVGVGGFFLGKLFSSPETQESSESRKSGKKTSSAAESSAESTEAVIAEALDPRAVALAIAEKEWNEMLEGITQDSLSLFMEGNPESSQLALSYKESVSSASPTVRLYAFEPQEAADLPGKMSLSALLSSLVMSRINTYGVQMIAASSVIPQLNPDNSYPYPWDGADLPFYVAETLIDGQARAVTLISFNEYHAVTASMTPLLPAVDFDLSSFLGQLKDEYSVVGKPVDISSVETAGVLEKLVPSAPSRETAEDLALKLAGIICDKASTDYLSSMKTPEEVIDVCLRCRAFSGTPSRIVRFTDLDLSKEALASITGTGEDLSAEMIEFLRHSIISQQAVFLNSMMGSVATAAGSLMTASLAVSGLKEESAVLWLCYEEADYPFVLAVSVLKNANGCYDLMAAPLFPREITDYTLQYAQGDTLTIDDVIKGLHDMSGR